MGYRGFLDDLLCIKVVLSATLPNVALPNVILLTVLSSLTYLNYGMQADALFIGIPSITKFNFNGIAEKHFLSKFQLL